jgi:hypothetical protein
VAERRLPRFISSPRTWKWLGIVLAAIVLLSALGVFHWVPIQSGRVVDMRTGKPIEGAVVKRVFYMPSLPTLIDTPPPTMIPLTYRETRTGPDGRFTFDPIFFPRLAGMALLVVKPGIMPFAGCYVERSWRWGGCSGFGFPADAWHQGTFDKSFTRLAIEIRLREPTMEGIRVVDWPLGEDWVEYNPTTKQHDLVKRFPDDVHPEELYFRKLNVFVQDKWLEPEVFADAAIMYVESGGVVTPDVWFYFRQQLAGLPIAGVLRLTSACSSTAIPGCSPEMTTWLFERQLAFQTCNALAEGDALRALTILDEAAPIPERLREQVVYGCYKQTSRGNAVVQKARRAFLEAQLAHCMQAGITCNKYDVQWVQRELGRSP